MGAATFPGVCADQLGPAFVIPCLHAKFPVVRGAESSKEHNLMGNPWNSHGKCSKEHGLELLFNILLIGTAEFSAAIHKKGKAAFYAQHSRRGIPVGTGSSPEQSGVLDMLS